MFSRKPKTGSTLCTSCGRLVGVADDTCWNCGRRNPGLWGFSTWLRRLGDDLGFVTLVVWGCAALYVASLLVDVKGIRTDGLFSFLSPSVPSLFMFGASGAVPVFGYGRWWTILSAGWLHGGVLHIAFNMMWVRQLAPQTAAVYGAGRMIIIYTVAAITGFLISTLAGLFFAAMPIFFLRGAQFTIGASAPIFGLLGSLVLYGRRGSTQLGSQALYYAVILFVFGIIAPGVDNYAHLGGFIGGYLVSKWLNPMESERADHMIVALLCLALTAASILASLFHGFNLFRQA